MVPALGAHHLLHPLPAAAAAITTSRGVPHAANQWRKASRVLAQRPAAALVCSTIAHALCRPWCRHAVAVPDLRGDQGHFVPCFMTFHRAVRQNTASVRASALRREPAASLTQQCRSSEAVCTCRAADLTHAVQACTCMHACCIPWDVHASPAVAVVQVMLEFENSLISVVPELQAMPYW